MIEFRNEILSITNFLRTGGYKCSKRVESQGGTANIYEITDGDLNLRGKKYFASEFLQAYREFLLEKNMKSVFIIDPLCIYKKSKEEYYLIMNYHKQFRKLVDDFKKLFSYKEKEIGLIRDKNLNTLLISTSLFHAIRALHVQRIPILHHDIKPGNILIEEFQFIDGKVIKADISSDSSGIVYKAGSIFFAKLIDFGLTKELRDITYGNGTLIYRTRGKYTESSEVLCLAIILIMLIHNVSDIKKLKVDNLIIVNSRHFGYIQSFQFIDESKVSGLEKIVNMMIKQYYERKSNIHEIMDILTSSKLLDYIDNDFLSKEEIDKYFNILKQKNIIMNYILDFEKIAHEILGSTYKPFLFSMFHQKNNEFNQVSFESYQKAIYEKYDHLHQDKIQLFNEIAELHFEKNFFSFREISRLFSEKFKASSKISQYSINARLFKILTNLDFTETRSLNYFANAINHIVYSIRIEYQYNFQLSFGDDYKAKIGFLLIKSDLDKDDFKLSMINDTSFSLQFRERLNLIEDLDTEQIITSTFAQFLKFYKKKTDKKVSSSTVTINDDKDDEQSITTTFNKDEETTTDTLNKEENNQDEIADIDELKKNCEKAFTDTFYNDEQHNNLYDYIHNQYGEDAPFLFIMHIIVLYIRNENKSRQELIKKHPINVKKDDTINSKKGKFKKAELEQNNENKEDISQETCNDKDLFALPFDDDNNDEENIFIWNESFIWNIVMKFSEIIPDVLSAETSNKFSSYLSFINKLKEFKVSDDSLDEFFTKINKDRKFVDLREFVLNFNFNENSFLNEIKFIELISYFSADTANKMLQFCAGKGDSNSKMVTRYLHKIKDDLNSDESSFFYFKNSVKMNYKNVIMSFGKFTYNPKYSLEQILKDDKSNQLSSTTLSKIVLYLVDCLNYMTNLPFKIQIKLLLSNIYYDNEYERLILIINPSEQYEYGEILNDFVEVVKELSKANEKNISEINHLTIDFLSIITNYSTKENTCHYLPFQYLHNFFFDKTFNFTFYGTKLDEFNEFVQKEIKNPFYDNERFHHYAYELFGPSYIPKLNYLFTKTRKDSNLTKEKFVNELIKITKKSSLLTIYDESQTLLNIANLIEQFFDDDDSYNWIHKLNQLATPDNEHKKRNENENQLNNDLFKYTSNDQKIIPYIYHLMNDFVSPLEFSIGKDLYFKVPKDKYTNCKEFLKGSSLKYHFLCSLRSALYYLSNYCKSDFLLSKELTEDDIFVNRNGEAIVLPFKVNNTQMNTIIESVQEELQIENFSLMKIQYSISSYIPLSNENSKKIMKAFGMSYLTEFNDIITNLLFHPIAEDKDNPELTIIEIYEKFNNAIKELNYTDKTENVENSNKSYSSIDEYVLHLSERVSNLTPFFIQLLFKASQSKNKDISDKAKKNLQIFFNIVQIDGTRIEIVRSLNNISGESDIFESKYYENDKKNKFRKVAYKKMKEECQNIIYLQKIKNLLFILKSTEGIDNYAVNEIGFTCFGVIMDYYNSNLDKDTSAFEIGIPRLQLIYRIFDIVSFFHSHNIVHTDIKESNFLLNNKKIFLGDLLGIKKVDSLFNHTMYSPKYYGFNLKNFKEKDVYAVKIIVLDLLSTDPLPESEFCLATAFARANIDCPLKNFLPKDPKNIEQGKIPYEISRYKNLMIFNDMHMILNKSGKKKEQEKKEMSFKFKNILVSQQVLPESFQKILDEKLSNKKDFEEQMNEINHIEETNSMFFISFIISFADKLNTILPELKSNSSAMFNNLIDIFDSKINSFFDNELNILSFQAENLIYQRLCLNKFEGIIKIKDDLYFKLKSRLLDMMKSYADQSESTEKVRFIINILEEYNDPDVGYFYHLIFPLNGDKNENFKDDIELRFSNVCFYYYFSLKNPEYATPLEYYEDLIFEIFDNLSRNAAERNNFKLLLLGDGKLNKPKDDVIISIFFYMFISKRNEFHNLFYIFEEVVQYAIKYISPKYAENAPENEHLKFLIDTADFVSKNREKMLILDQALNE
ncbi:hypothetical protein M9Y10_034092 [Tritrichomonas musculus]|uniref:Protein kinase domain-containing protein n=1 Tax=Tritrichomonas musculus TaxID=1915356 RepID=A0ABR2KE09_9EUKA